MHVMYVWYICMLCMYVGMYVWFAIICYLWMMHCDCMQCMFAMLGYGMYVKHALYVSCVWYATYVMYDMNVMYVCM